MDSVTHRELAAETAARELAVLDLRRGVEHQREILTGELAVAEELHRLGIGHVHLDRAGRRGLRPGRVLRPAYDGAQLEFGGFRIVGLVGQLGDVETGLYGHLRAPWSTNGHVR